MKHNIPLGMLGTVVLAMTLIVIGDTAGKALTVSGASPFFVAWSRFTVAAVVLLPFAGLRSAELRGFLDWRIILRSVLIATGILCILTAAADRTHRQCLWRLLCWAHRGLCALGAVC